MINRRFSSIVILVGVVIAAFLAWQGYEYLKHRGLAGLSVVVLPDDSALTLDGNSVKPGRLYLTPGVHNLKATRADFGDDTKTINTADIQKGDVIYMLPKASTLAAKDWLVQHPAVQRAREAAGGAEAERERRLLISNYPFLDKLPQENLHYKIDYSINSQQVVSLTITTLAIINGPADYPNYVQNTKAYRQEAINFLKQNGVDVSTFKITYIPDLQ
jgi:hypothetical protein